MKQTMINKIQINISSVKNPTWREADQLAIYKREVELGATEDNISSRSERDLNPRPTDFKSGALATRPRYLKPFIKMEMLSKLNFVTVESQS